jgi:hypothetical protein
VREKIRAPWLIGAIASSLIAVALIGSLYTSQSRREAKLEEDLQAAVQDSTRYGKEKNYGKKLLPRACHKREDLRHR